MDLRPHVDNLRQELIVVAEAGGEEMGVLAERLFAALDSATRITLLGALSDAADELTRELAPSSVEIRLRGTDPTFVVTSPAADRSFHHQSPNDGLDDSFGGIATAGLRGAAASSAEDGTVARINFRPPEQLKVRIEEAAYGEGLSINAWLVRAVGAMLNAEGRGSERRNRRGENSIVGWVR